MTVCSPPLIKPDGRFSRIRLSEFLSRGPKPPRQIGFATPRRFWALIAPRGAVTTSLVALPPAEQVASLRSPAGCPNQRFSTGSSLLRTPPSPFWPCTPSRFKGVVPPFGSFFPAITGLPVYPSVTPRHVAHVDPAGLMSRPSTVSLDRDPSAFALKLEARLPGISFRG